MRNFNNLENISETLWNLKTLQKLDIIYIPKFQFPDTFDQLENLTSLTLQGCENLSYLPSNIDQLKYLKILIVSNCNKIENLPHSLCKLRKLKRLKINWCGGIKELPPSLGTLYI